jgi:hypothetical protein
MRLLEWVASWVSGLEIGDRFSLAMVLVVRNAAIATAIVVTVLGRRELAGLVTACFCDRMPIMVAALFLL